MGYTACRRHIGGIQDEADALGFAQECFDKYAGGGSSNDNRIGRVLIL